MSPRSRSPGRATRWQHPQLLHTGDSIEVDDPTLGPTRQFGPLFTASAKPTTGSAAAPPAPHAGASLLQGVTVLELATWIATPMATALSPSSAPG